MTAERIEKLRIQAERGGSEGERQNAKDILAKVGVDWRRPKESIKDTIKETFGGNIRKEYRVPITFASDVLLMMRLLTEYANGAGIQIDGKGMRFHCTPAQMKDISKIFEYNKKEFDVNMNYEAMKYMNNYY